MNSQAHSSIHFLSCLPIPFEVGLGVGGWSLSQLSKGREVGIILDMLPVHHRAKDWQPDTLTPTPTGNLESAVNLTLQDSQYLESIPPFWEHLCLFYFLASFNFFLPLCPLSASLFLLLLRLLSSVRTALSNSDSFCSRDEEMIVKTAHFSLLLYLTPLTFSFIIFK